MVPFSGDLNTWIPQFLPYEKDERTKLFFDMSEVEGGGRDFAGENDRVMRG